MSKRITHYVHVFVVHDLVGEYSEVSLTPIFAIPGSVLILKVEAYNEYDAICKGLIGAGIVEYKNHPLNARVRVMNLDN